jgi:alpha-glucosidase
MSPRACRDMLMKPKSRPFGPLAAFSLLAILCGALAQSPSAQTVSIASPTGEIQADVAVDAAGRLCYSLQRLTGSKTVLLKSSPLGIFVNGIDLGSGVKLGQTRRLAGNEQYPWRGVHSVATNQYDGVEIAVTHVESSTPFTIEFRVFPGGLGYRYIVPGAGQRTLNGEASAWNLPDDCQIWYQTNVANYEGSYGKAAPAQLKPNLPLGFPVVVLYADGTYGAITEAGLFAYSGMTLRATGSTLLQGVFEDDRSWQETGEIRSPWRVTLTGPDLNALVNCDVVPNLCPPPDNALFPQGLNTGWIKPGRSLWNWWSDSSVAFQYQKEWVDKAAELGFEYYLVDAGWDRWNQPGKDVWACLTELCDYARQKGVGIQVWRHWNTLQQPAARQDFLQHCAKAGAICVKIDFMDSESRSRIDFYTQTLQEAAKNKLMVNFHGANKPTGEARTYPNEMTREGIQGLEYNKWTRLPPTHYASLPFTRYLAGHADFTPCTFNSNRLYGTTVTLQLASAVVFTSPILNWADHWRFYTASPALEVLKQVPSTWDQTCVLPGSDIGQLAAFARRKGQLWFVGIINGGAGRTYSLDTAFLGNGKYKAVLVGDVAGKPAEMNVSSSTLEKGQKLALALEPGGGFVACLSPEK